jgi:glycosyltransferase involved in cell wall biosynthesis
VTCGLDAPFLDAEPSPAPSAPKLVSVGRLVEQKGQLVLVEAAARLRDEGIAFEIDLIGDGPMRGDLVSAIDRLGLGDRVKLLGWRSNSGVREAIRGARALVLPSFAEGLPVVLMESLALARPAISTYVAGIPELVEPGVSGWLVPPGAVEALASAMKAALLARPEDLDRMGRAGRAIVARRHDASRSASLLASLFRDPEGSP